MLDYNTIKEKYSEENQSHVFQYWDELSSPLREKLLLQASEIDLNEVSQLIDEHITCEETHSLELSKIKPAQFIPRPDKIEADKSWKSAIEYGIEAISAGRVAAFTVAGGQGTRLGFDGPKGTFPVGIVSDKTLFQIFSEKILAANRRYNCSIPWFIMTSHANNNQTVDFFEKNNYFGLNKNTVNFVIQGRMPSVDKNGKIMLQNKSTISMSPDGHGGSFRALCRSGAIKQMEDLNCDIISYFQVDNPIVHCIDPAFIGFHLINNSDMSSKMVKKVDASEKVGIFTDIDNRTSVIEYSDMPDALINERDNSGELLYQAGSIAIHIISRDFAKKIGHGDSEIFRMPFHRADKKINTIAADGSDYKPKQPNGIKFEMFVFDALPIAKNPIVLETLRQDEFSPVKNAEGSDSLKTCQEDQLKQWIAWLKSVGVNFHENEDTKIKFEISPLFADSFSSFKTKWESLLNKPEIVDGLYLEN